MISLSQTTPLSKVRVSKRPHRSSGQGIRLLSDLSWIWIKRGGDVDKCAWTSILTGNILRHHLIGWTSILTENILIYHLIGRQYLIQKKKKGNSDQRSEKINHTLRFTEQIQISSIFEDVCMCVCVRVHAHVCTSEWMCMKVEDQSPCCYLGIIHSEFLVLFLLLKQNLYESATHQLG